MPHIILKVAGLLAMLVSIAVPLAGQSTEAEIKTRLKDKPLYLRGFWREDDLRFDANGNLISKSSPYPFTLAGFDLRSVHLKKDKLILDGKRMGTEFEKDLPKRVSLGSLRIEIALPASSDFGPALTAIFADGLTDLAPNLPSYWQKWARLKLLPAQPDNFVTGTPSAHSTSKQDEKPSKVGGVVTEPRITYQTDASFNEYARQFKFGGTVLVNFIISKNGLVTDPQVLKPLGLGLDEEALRAVAKYRFEPATRNGDPVRVEMNVEIGFHIY